MSDQPKDPHPKKRVVRSRVAAPSATVAAPAEPSAAATVPAAALPVRDPAEEPKAADLPAQKRADEPKAADPADAAARALAALAANQAKKAAPPAAEPVAPARFSPSALVRQPLAQAAAVLVALGAGWFGAMALSPQGDARASTAQWAETAQSLRQGQQDVVRLTGDIKALKVALDSLKESVDRSKTDLMAKQSQVMERVEKADRAPADTTARFAKLAEQLDRVEAAAKDPGVKLAAFAERFERLERQMTTLQTAAAKPATAPIPAAAVPAGAAPAPAPAEPMQTGTLEAKPVAKEAKDGPVEGWILHEVYDGVALIEGRNRRLFEVGPGSVIPGVGAVESIERRGKRWVVQTTKGIIGNDR